MVPLAHRFAFESAHVTADMIEAQEFSERVVRHGVVGVPKTAINKTCGIEGAVPEAALLRAVLESVGARG